jgi:hypothetical protein
MTLIVIELTFIEVLHLKVMLYAIALSEIEIIHEHICLKFLTDPILSYFPHL